MWLTEIQNKAQDARPQKTQEWYQVIRMIAAHCLRVRMEDKEVAKEKGNNWSEAACGRFFGSANRFSQLSIC